MLSSAFSSFSSSATLLCEVVDTGVEQLAGGDDTRDELMTGPGASTGAVKSMLGREGEGGGGEADAIRGLRGAAIIASWVEDDDDDKEVEEDEEEEDTSTVPLEFVLGGPRTDVSTGCG
mmetsp:Transcript_640/g.1589  ORF Transcript_640/g.1589 Transcript_640/m.1589 type:complete len:119 (+) Transcript_640:470-826(+)